MSVVNLVDDKLNLITEFKKGSRVGYQAIQRMEYPPSQGAGTYSAGQQLSYNIPVSGGNYVDSSAEVVGRFTITIKDDGTNIKTNEATALAYLLNRFGFHSMPLNRAIASATIKFNQATNMSSNPATDVEAYLYSSSEEELKNISTLGIPDHQMDYNSAINTDVLRNSMDSLSWSRGLGQVKSVSTAYDTGVETLVFDVSEKLIARPLQVGLRNRAFVGLNSLFVNLTLGSNFVQSSVASSVPNGVITCAISNLRLRLTEFTPHIIQDMPSTAYWNIPILEQTDSSSATITAGSTGSFQTATHPFNVVPKVFMVYAFETRPTDGLSPQRLFPLDDIVVEIGLKKHEFRNYTPDILYNISRKNGYNMPPHAFSGGFTGALSSGCMFIFTPSDVDSPELFQSNVVTNFNFKATATIRNNDTANHDVVLRCVSITDAYLIYENGMFREEVASIEPSEIASGETRYLDTTIKNLVLGGSLWSWLRDKALKPAVRWLRKSDAPANFLSKIDPRLGKAYKVGQELVDKSGIGSKLEKQGYGIIDVGAGDMPINVGGKQASKKEMLKMLKIK